MSDDKKVTWVRTHKGISLVKDTYDAGNLTIEDVSVEILNKSGRPGCGSPESYICKSTREFENPNWLEYEIKPGEKVELPHGRYKIFSESGGPCFVDTFYGDEKTRHKNKRLYQKN